MHSPSTISQVSAQPLNPQAHDQATRKKSGITADWRADLEASRDIRENEQKYYSSAIAWLETWRTRQRLSACRGTARRFWKEEVQKKERKDWQSWDQG